MLGPAFHRPIREQIKSNSNIMKQSGKLENRCFLRCQAHTARCAVGNCPGRRAQARTFHLWRLDEPSLSSGGGKEGSRDQNAFVVCRGQTLSELAFVAVTLILIIF